MTFAAAWKEIDPDIGWTVTPAAAAFLDHLEWEHEELSVKSYELPEHTLWMEVSSIDCFAVKDKRLFPINHSTTWRYCLDLKDLRPDPAVWLLSMDTGRVKRVFPKLSRFLGCLDAP